MPAQNLPTEVPQIPPPADVAQPPADAVRTSNSASTLFLSSRVISPGRGASRPGKYDIVTVKYTLWTTDGRTIDTASLRAQPSRWTMSEVVEGLQLGLALMVAGEIRRFWIPPGMSYDWARSTLVFDVELLNIEAVADSISDTDLLGPPADAPRMPNGVAYRVLRPAGSGERPKPMSTVTIHYTGWTGRSKVDDSVARGEPLVVAIDTLMPGLSAALTRMAVGERTRYWIPAALAYKPPGPPLSAWMFDVELLAIQRADAGQAGTVETRTNSIDAAYVLVDPDGTGHPYKGPQTIAGAVPGRYRVKPTIMRSYACGLLASPASMVLSPSGRLTITITYRPIVH